MLKENIFGVTEKFMKEILIIEVLMNFVSFNKEKIGWLMMVNIKMVKELVMEQHIYLIQVVIEVLL